MTNFNLEVNPGGPPGHFLRARWGCLIGLKQITGAKRQWLPGDERLVGKSPLNWVNLWILRKIPPTCPNNLVTAFYFCFFLLSNISPPPGVFYGRLFNCTILDCLSRFSAKTPTRNQFYRPNGFDSYCLVSVPKTTKNRGRGRKVTSPVFYPNWLFSSGSESCSEVSIPLFRSVILIKKVRVRKRKPDFVSIPLFRSVILIR